MKTRPSRQEKIDNSERRNMRKTRIVFTMLIGCMAFTASAKDDTTQKSDGDTPKGKAIITIFSDVHSGFGAYNNDRGFNLDRAYIGYQYDLTHELQIKAIADFGRSKEVNDYQRIGFIKNASVAWKRDKWTLNAGLITTTQFKIQEDFWGKRYIMKSFQDEYSFGSSADLGVNVAYQFNKYLSADVILVNGEGYKKIQVKDGLQYGAGITVNPIETLILRAYGSFHEATEDGEKGIANFAAFAGYKHKSFSLAAEYNYQANTSFVSKQNLNGVSVYTNIPINKNVSIFGRWDRLSSNDRWNEADDGMAGIAGAEFKIGKYIKLAPNFRIWSPKQTGAPKAYYAYLNASFNL